MKDVDTYFTGMALKAIGWFLFGSPSEKRRARQACAYVLTRLLGDFPFGTDYKLWRTDTEFFSDYRKLSLSPYMEERKFLVRETARFTKNVPGAMAECGCYEGASSYFMAKERPGVPLHLFDSFQGLSAVGDMDKVAKADIFAWQGGDLTASEEVLRKRVQGFANVFIHKGWIPEKFHE